MNWHNRTNQEIYNKILEINPFTSMSIGSHVDLPFYIADLINQYKVSIRFNKSGKGGVCEIHKEGMVYQSHFSDDSELMRAVCLAIIESVGGWE